MIKEAYVSFEIAKLLKEKGFDEYGTYFYTLKDEGCEGYKSNRTLGEFAHNSDPNLKDRAVSCPTHQMAMKWLREKGFHINAPISYDYSVDADGNVVDKWTFWTFEILSSFSGKLIYTEEVNEYYSYEEAVEAALKYSLENLI